jgi:hypothetical protein
MRPKLTFFSPTLDVRGAGALVLCERFKRFVVGLVGEDQGDRIDRDWPMNVLGVIALLLESVWFRRKPVFEQIGVRLRRVASQRWI